MTRWTLTTPANVQSKNRMVSKQEKQEKSKTTAGRSWIRMLNKKEKLLTTPSHISTRMELNSVKNAESTYAQSLRLQRLHASSDNNEKMKKPVLMKNCYILISRNYIAYGKY